MESWVSIKELQRACFKMRSQAAIGIDCLSILLVQRCFRELTIFLQRLFIASLRLGAFPTPWRIASIIALCKPGKSSYAEARAYRPISLLNHLSKFLEVIVNNRLKNWIEAHQLLSPFQWGFCPSRHVQGACWRLVEEVTSALRARDQIQAMALDIQAAYDSVWRARSSTKNETEKVSLGI